MEWLTSATAALVDRNRFLKWLLFCSKLLAMSAVRRCQCWAGCKSIDAEFPSERIPADNGLGPWLNTFLVYPATNLRSSAKALRLLHGVVADCSPTRANCRSVFDEAKRLFRDIVMCYCVQQSGIEQRFILDEALTEAFDGDIDRQLRSQLMNSYHKTIGILDGSFQSKNSRGTKRPRKYRAP
jgi:hypothetical protein